MKKGFTIIEMLIVILIGVLIIGVMVGLYVAHQRAQVPTKMVSDILEIQRSGIAQLEWIFSRWGTGTPCNDPTGANICTRIRPCDIENVCDIKTNPQNPNCYPPPSSLCISISNGTPCSEVWFYGNLEGMGIASYVYRDRIRLVSCRLKTENNNNCFHIMRHGRFFRDANNQNVALIFGLSELSEQNAECLSPSYLDPATYNADANRVAVIYNGNILNQAGNLQNWLLLEGGDIIIRVPKLIHLYCETGPDGRRWLKMDLTDKAENCNANEPAINISPVENFYVSIVTSNEEITDTSQIDNPQDSNYLNLSSASIKVDITFRNFENQTSPNYKTYRIIRYFGR